MPSADAYIYEAMAKVENAGCHPFLTDAVILLQQARDKVADFVELRVDAGHNASLTGGQEPKDD